MAIVNMQDYINKLYDPQKAAAQSAYDATAGDINAQITNAPTVYQPYRNNAYTTQLQQQRLYNENMANMGYSGAGQMSQTLQQRASNNLQSTLGGIDTAQQAYINSLNSDLRGATASLQGNLASVEANRGSALLNVYSAEQSRADQLYAAGIISAAQYQQMTGMTPLKINRGGGGGGGSGGDINDYIQSQLSNRAANINSMGMDATATRNLALGADTINYTGYKDGVYWYKGQIVSKADYLRARSGASQN